MNKEKQELVDAVIEQLKKDFDMGDYTVLDELLGYIPKKVLLQSLPEEMWSKFEHNEDEVDIWNSITNLLSKI